MRFTKEQNIEILNRYNAFLGQTMKETGIDWLDIKDWIRRWENRQKAAHKKLMKEVFCDECNNN